MEIMTYGDFNYFSRRTVSDKFFYVIKHLILLKIKNMMDIREGLLQCFTEFSIKNLLRLQNLLLTQEQELIPILKKNNQKNYTSQLLANVKKVKYTHPLKATYGIII